MVNKVILIGNVGADPEIRSLESGIKVAKFRLATTERIYDRQANVYKDYTEWHNITVWQKLADVADKFVRKGSQLYIEGSIRYREWSDRDGIKHNSVEIAVNDMKLLGRRSDNSQAQQPAVANSPYTAPQPQPAEQSRQQGAMQTPPPVPDDCPDDLPF